MNETAPYILSYDIGTTGLKTCLYHLAEKLELKETAHAPYPLHILPRGGAEQNPEDWWQAMILTTKQILVESGIDTTCIAGITFCSQMQGLVLIDKQGRPLRRAFSYLDGRGVEQQRQGLQQGLKIAGMNAYKLFRSLAITGGVSASVKDPLWKYHWVREKEPDLFRQVHKWLDVKDFLVSRCTGRFVMTPDSANVTFLYDTRPGKQGWSAEMLKLFRVEPKHLPEVIPALTITGPLTAQAAKELGLRPGTAVNSGGGDLTCTSLGAGCVRPGDTHLYLGTSGWAATVVDKRYVDTNTMMASILGALPGLYNYIGEQETAGKCMEWARDQLSLATPRLSSQDTRPESGAFRTAVARAAPGCGGVIFTPWLHGNRSPFEDPLARGMFFNLSLDTGKVEMLRAVEEGIAFHMRWLLESMETKIKVADTLRFAGGGVNETTAQIMADITGRTLAAVELPEHAGATGAALLCTLALEQTTERLKTGECIAIRKVYSPDTSRQELYASHYRVFKRLYATNKKNFHLLTATHEGV